MSLKKCQYSSSTISELPNPDFRKWLRICSLLVSGKYLEIKTDNQDSNCHTWYIGTQIVLPGKLNIILHVTNAYSY